MNEGIAVGPNPEGLKSILVAGWKRVADFSEDCQRTACNKVKNAKAAANLPREGTPKWTLN
jgi:hypothetical protein